MRNGITLALGMGCVMAVRPIAADTCAFQPATSAFESLLAGQQLPGGALLVGDRQGIHLERYFGSYEAGTVVAIASASKLLSAVRMVQLAEQGLLDLAAPVSTYLPQFSGDKGTMTVAQMFSHTAGYGEDSGVPVIASPLLTLAQAVDQIACCRPLNAGYTVGGQFSYGGVSMHIAGRVAEVRTGLDWPVLWQQQLGAPLGITTIDWEASSGSNWGIAGGARSNLRDYGRVLHMLANHGRGNGRQLLSRASVAQLVTDRAGELPIAYAPPNVPKPVRYGLGQWLTGTQAEFSHSLGAFGFFPWLNRTRESWGVFMVRGGAGFNTAAVPVYEQMLADIDADLASGSCDWVERFDEVLVGGFEE